jgi:hypothetical protein
MRAALFAGVSAVFAAVASAWVTPVGTTPSGNSIIKPGLAEIVPAGKPYTITWDPTTAGPVTLLLLRGPSTNVKPLYAIAQHIPNSGTYSWTPSTSLEADVTHYGIQLIDEKTGAFQYSTQFGISNPTPSKPSTSSPPTSSSPAIKPESVGYGGYGSPSSVAAAHTYAPPAYGGKHAYGGKPSVIYSTTYSTLTSCSCETETPTPAAAATYPASPAPYGAPVYPSGVPAPSGTAAATGTGVPGAGSNSTTPTYVAPSGPVYSSTGPTPPLFTGAASQVKVGGVMVGIVAGLAVALF